MTATELTVEGAFLFTAQVFHDDRGFFTSPLQHAEIVEATGEPLFRVRQMSLSQSRRGVLRGIHYTRTPPGTGQYVHCPQGRGVDFVVDLRVGSPTFGRWDAIELDRRSGRAIYFPVGTGHAFLALEDDTVVSYMLSTPYVPENELSVTPFDPDLALPFPDGVEPVVTPRDVAAPTVAQALERGLLPEHRASRDIQALL